MSLNKRETDFLNNVKHDTLELITKVEKLEQQIINLNAKYKHQINEIMLILENRKEEPIELEPDPEDLPNIEKDKPKPFVGRGGIPGTRKK